MSKRLCFLPILFCFLTGKSQDSTYYNFLWQPTENYRKAGITQEGVFLYYYNNNSVADSVLKEVKFYDSLGRITRYQYYKKNKLASRSTYFYTGSYLDSILHEQLETAVAKTKTRYHYHADGTIATIRVLDSSGNTTISYRYVYNALRQPLQIFTQSAGENELLGGQYKYLKNHLIDRIDNYFPKESNKENFSYLYDYADGGKTTTRFIHRPSNRFPTTDVVRIYNRENQLIKRITPYSGSVEKSVSQLKFTVENTEETFIYLPSGMLSEIQLRRKGAIISTEKHIYK